MSSVDLPLSSHRQFASSDFDAMHHQLGIVLKPHGLRRLSNAPVSGIINRSRLNRTFLNVLRIGPSVDVSPDTLDNFFLVQIPIFGTVELSLGTEQVLCEGSMAAVVSPGERLRLRWSDNCTQIILQIPRETMEARLAERLGFRSRIALRFETAFDLRRAAAWEWRQLFDFAVRTVDSGGMLSSDPICAELENLLLSALLAAQPHNHAGELRQGRGPAPFYVTRAEQEMRKAMARPLTVAGLAGAAGVSERTLHDGFRRFRGTTPMGALMMLRLEAARRLMQQAAPGTTVTNVAAKVGISQLGRFAKTYRGVFGELPSETLRGAPRSLAAFNDRGSSA
jgi:AraC-like DNA-binding protein